MPKFILLTMVLAGCTGASKKNHSEVSYLPESIQIENVAFENQKMGHCGPAVLSMAMKWEGSRASADELAKFVFTPKAEGSYQSDLVSAARRNGMIALPLEGEQALFEEVASQHPVIVFENLGLSWWPQWHYALVTGYDLKDQSITLHSGDTANQKESLSEFRRSWNLAGNWGLLILKPGKISAFVPELDQLQAIAALEDLGFKEEALSSYRSLLKRWPNSLGGLMGIANIEFSKENYKQSAKLLRQVIQLYPDFKPAQQNLSVVQTKF